MSLIQIVIANLAVSSAISGLAAWLGKVWATRISQRENHRLSSELEFLKATFGEKQARVEADLALQKDLSRHTHESATQERALIFEKQLNLVIELWEKWLKFRSDASAFITPYMILSHSEMENHFREFRSKIFPYTPEQMDEKLAVLTKFHEGLEKLRPLLPLPIYEHTKAVASLYTRIALKLYLQVPSGEVPHWHLDEKGKVDYSVQALLKYSTEAGFSLTTPENDSLINDWRTALEEKMASLVFEFVHGTLKRQSELSAAIKSLDTMRLTVTTLNPTTKKE